MLPEEAICHADSVVIGEVELVWRDLPGNFSLNRAGDTELLKLAAQGGCIRMGLRFEASYL